MATNQARTILGPLTTVASLPSTCSFPIEDCATCDQAWGGQTCFASTSTDDVNYGVQDNTDCWPTTTSFVANPPIPLQGWGFYSPGISCPSGMVTACSATAGGKTGWPVQFAMQGGETAVGCCPTGFSCTNNGLAQTCQQYVTSTTVEVGSCVSGVIGLSTYVTVPQAITTTVSGSVSVVTQQTYHLYAPLIQLNWQASDRSSSTTSSSSTSSSTSSATSTIPSETGSPTSTNTPSSHSGLSAGASAGIGVGAALGAIALLALAFFIFRKRKNAKGTYAQAELGSPSEATHYDRKPPVSPYPPSATPPYTGSELPTDRPRTELPSNYPVYEMGER